MRADTAPKYFLEAPDHLLRLPRREHRAVFSGTIIKNGGTDHYLIRRGKDTVSAAPQDKWGNPKWFIVEGPARALLDCEYRSAVKDAWFRLSGYGPDDNWVYLKDGSAVLAEDLWELWRLLGSLAAKDPGLFQTLVRSSKRYAACRPNDPEELLSAEPYRFTDRRTGLIHPRFKKVISQMTYAGSVNIAMVYPLMKN